MSLNILQVFSSRIHEIMRNNVVFISIILTILVSSCSSDRKLRVDTSVMEPTIKKGDVLSYTHLVSKIKKGDVVYFEMPINDGTSIMRVFGLPGDEIIIDFDEGIYLNGTLCYSYEVIDDNLKKNIKFGSGNPYIVPENCYYLLGDNWKIANDSRCWGALEQNRIIGVIN